MERAFLGISHTPLMGLNRIDTDIERALKEAIEQARTLIKAYRPELIVLVAPDHYNGFVNELMPPFCIGTAATAIGDYMTPSGALHVDAETALGLAEHMMDAGFDAAVSRRMLVDHGFAQPLQLLWDGLETPSILPIFMNAVAAPGIPRIRRTREFGESIGRFLDSLGRKTLLIGSGGLSHEPPVPTLSDPDPVVRERITVRRMASPAELQARSERVVQAGLDLAAGRGSLKPLNRAWDLRWMNLLRGDAAALDELCSMSEASIGQEGGMSAHESKTWLIGRSALNTPTSPRCSLNYYQDIPEYIAGFGLLWLSTPAP